jgi:hypothetical protein
MSELPCNVKLQIQPSCGFVIQLVRMALLKAIAKEDCESTTNGTGPFFLYGTQNVNNTYSVSNNTIALGSYTLTAVINGIEHPSMDFFVDDKVRCCSRIHHFHKSSTDDAGCIATMVSSFDNKTC